MARNNSLKYYVFRYRFNIRYFPTIANFLGLNSVNEVDGFPLHNIFSGLKKGETSYYLYYGVQGRPAAIRVDNWKLIFDIPVGGAGEKKKKKNTYHQNLNMNYII